jgi:2-haloacid dehalogenase
VSHEGPQLPQVAEGASPRLSDRAPPRPDLCHQQDQPPVQGAPGLTARPTAVVFDVGHVLYDWDPRYLYAKLIADPAELDWFLSHVVTRAWHFQHDAGRSFADTSAELIARFPAYADLIRAYGPRWNETIPGPIPGMLDLVADLAARGVPLFAITNFGGEFWAMFRPTAPVFDAFRDIVVSGVEKLTKPGPEIYALALRRFGLGPGEGAFIDDRADNIAAADAAGLVGHVFVDAAETRAWLTGLGLL